VALVDRGFNNSDASLTLREMCARRPDLCSSPTATLKSLRDIFYQFATAIHPEMPTEQRWALACDSHFQWGIGFLLRKAWEQERSFTQRQSLTSS
jgi:hypothetical protein